MRAILQLMISGFWQGVGVECSFFLLWVIWKVMHSRHGHRFDPEHFFHVIDKYFSK